MQCGGDSRVSHVSLSCGGGVSLLRNQPARFSSKLASIEVIEMTARLPMPSAIPVGWVVLAENKVCMLTVVRFRVFGSFHCFQSDSSEASDINKICISIGLFLQAARLERLGQHDISQLFSGRLSPFLKKGSGPTKPGINPNQSSNAVPA